MQRENLKVEKKRAKDKILSVRIRSSEFEALERIASSEHCSISAIISASIKELIEKPAISMSHQEENIPKEQTQPEWLNW